MGFFDNLFWGDSQSGTPLMSLVTNLLITEAAAIIFLSLPFQIKFRRSLVEWLVTSPILRTTRTVFVTIFGFIAFLLLDSARRLNRLYARKALDLVSAENLYAQRNRVQRDFFLLCFTLFCALVLYQLQMVLLRMGRYRKERNALINQVKSLGAEPVKLPGMDGARGGKVLRPAATNATGVKTE
ncbi:B-cell receptor-associated protein 31-like-domain-containing protein [Phlyctochytrium arcticum]|nr:B-cell receptor-associated protein 31-like-domain-containing protein [Phlyctochytrium arcticum]